MLYALKSKDSRELTGLIQLLKSRKVADHWIEVIIKKFNGYFHFKN